MIAVILILLVVVAALVASLLWSASAEFGSPPVSRKRAGTDERGNGADGDAGYVPGGNLDECGPGADGSSAEGGGDGGGD